MNIGNSLNQIRENSNLNLYNNLNYQTERIDKKIIMIDSAFCNCYDTSIDGDKDEMGNFVPGGNIGKLTKECINFDTSLNDNVIIDKDCEIYINSIYSKDINFDTPIYLKINEIKNEIVSNNPFNKNMYIIIGEDGRNICRNKKINYFTTINSRNIKDLSFSIVKEDKTNNYKNIGIFNSEESRLIIELLFIIKK